MSASGRHQVNGALKAVEGAGLLAHRDRESPGIIIPANVASCHDGFPAFLSNFFLESHSLWLHERFSLRGETDCRRKAVVPDAAQHERRRASPRSFTEGVRVEKARKDDAVSPWTGLARSLAHLDPIPVGDDEIQERHIGLEKRDRTSRLESGRAIGDNLHALVLEEFPQLLAKQVVRRQEEYAQPVVAGGECGHAALLFWAV
jgi:hypothetical protein